MSKPLRILLALSGLHRVHRGAEVAFLTVAEELARAGEEVTVIGSGPARPSQPYEYRRVGVIPRERFERFPGMPGFRNETSWEEATFAAGLARAYRPQDHDVTLTCSYPYVNWLLRARRHKARRPAHVFVTQNGDWPARSDTSEYRWFGCDGLVCINPDYFAANRARYRSALIPNGADLTRFVPGPGDRPAFGLPLEVPLVLMASALIESKEVGAGIEAVSRLPGVHLAVAGDGPLRDDLRRQAERLMPGRYHNLTVTADRMPDLYRNADLFLHLSREEAFGNVFVEATASGKQTVAWNLPRTRWILGDTALYVVPGDGAALSEAIGRGLAHPFPPGDLRRRAEPFSWSLIARQYRDFLAEVVSAQRGQ